MLPQPASLTLSPAGFFCPSAAPPPRHTFAAYTARDPPVGRARGVGHWGVEKLTKRTISEAARPLCPLKWDKLPPRVPQHGKERAKGGRVSFTSLYI